VISFSLLSTILILAVEDAHFKVKEELIPVPFYIVKLVGLPKFKESIFKTL
jgi:hypothetical protein